MEGPSAVFKKLDDRVIDDQAVSFFVVILCIVAVICGLLMWVKPIWFFGYTRVKTMFSIYRKKFMR